MARSSVLIESSEGRVEVVARPAVCAERWILATTCTVAATRLTGESLPLKVGVSLTSERHAVVVVLKEVARLTGQTESSTVLRTVESIGRARNAASNVEKKPISTFCTNVFGGTNYTVRVVAGHAGRVSQGGQGEAVEQVARVGVVSASLVHSDEAVVAVQTVLVGSSLAPQARGIARLASGSGRFEVGVFRAELFVGSNRVGEVQVCSRRRHDAGNVRCPTALNAACCNQRRLTGVGSAGPRSRAQESRPVARQAVTVGRSLAAGAGSMTGCAGCSAGVVVLAERTERITSSPAEEMSGCIAAGTSNIRGIVGQAVGSCRPLAMASH